MVGLGRVGVGRCPPEMQQQKFIAWKLDTKMEIDKICSPLVLLICEAGRRRTPWHLLKRSENCFRLSKWIENKQKDHESPALGGEEFLLLSVYDSGWLLVSSNELYRKKRPVMLRGAVIWWRAKAAKPFSTLIFEKLSSNIFSLNWIRTFCMNFLETVEIE